MDAFELWPDGPVIEMIICIELLLYIFKNSGDLNMLSVNQMNAQIKLG